MMAQCGHNIVLQELDDLFHLKLASDVLQATEKLNYGDLKLRDV